MKKTSKKDTKKTTKKNVDEATFKSFAGLDLSKIPGSVTEILTTNWEKFSGCRTFEDVVALCHELFDNAGLDTEWTNKFFYNLDQIKERMPNPRRAFEQAMYYVNNARFAGMGMGLGRRRFYEGEEECKGNKCESKSACKYTKKQIMEAIAHWEGVLESMNESVTFADANGDLKKVIDDVNILRDNGEIDEEKADEIFSHLEAVEDLLH